MKKAIWKYNLEVSDNQTIEMPIGSKVLTAQTQNGKVCLWVLVDTGEELMESRNFEVLGTGNPILHDAKFERKYISTFQLMQGSFVGHIFEQVI